MYRVVFIFALFLHYMCIIRALPTYGLVIREKSGALKKVFIIAVRSSRTSYRFRSLHSSCSRKRSFQKGSKKTALSFTHSAALRFAPFVHSFADFLHILESSQGGLCASGARSNASTVSPVASCICFAVALRFVGCLFPQAGPSL